MPAPDGPMMPEDRALRHREADAVDRDVVAEALRRAVDDGPRASDWGSWAALACLAWVSSVAGAGV